MDYDLWRANLRNIRKSAKAEGNAIRRMNRIPPSTKELKTGLTSFLAK